jgi:hypothetical protein
MGLDLRSGHIRPPAMADDAASRALGPSCPSAFGENVGIAEGVGEKFIPLRPSFMERAGGGGEEVPGKAP